ncbi:carbohydrate-binding protein [Actinoallomurus rhizosphaericola]|uniref:carbohydrate-binding protein n=1 Tax=Actinoallomurus rhizosphaericola TaxID=2952536 RepID=UPI00209398D6|nr:carbohydrate-binding protein [Actinoallomurus rhizosphaericola]MCO5999590.1 carbohydrate-binding protein [Actinoallomurus rhizosphaericola]
MSDLKENERRRQERAELVNAFTRTAWQPSSRPQLGPRVLAGGAALIVVAGAAFGLGAMASYHHKQDASEHTRQLALAAQNGRANPSVQAPGSAIGVTISPGAPTPGSSAPGNAAGQPVVPGRIAPRTKGPNGKTTPPVSAQPQVTGGQQVPASPPAGVNAAAAGGTVHTQKKAGAARSASPRRMTPAEVAAQQGGETAPYIVPVTPTASPAATATPSPTRRFVRSVRPTKSPTSGSSGDKAPARGGRSAYSTIQAESFARRSKHLSTENSKDIGGGRNIASAASGDWALYKRIDFGSTPATQLYARIATDKPEGYGRVEVVLDDPGSAPIATLYTVNTGGWQNWSTVSVGASGVTGVHNVYLRFKSDQIWDFININWFCFGH